MEFFVSVNSLILSSYGGGAHESARALIESKLGELGISHRVMYPIHEMRPLFFSSSEKTFYNSPLTKDRIFSIKILASLGRQFFRVRQSQVESLITRKIEEYKPHFIVSICPMINTGAIRAACRYKIPYFLITVDRDLRNYMLPQSIPSSAQIKIFTVDEMNLGSLSLFQEKVGFPLRAQFMERIEATQDQLKQNFCIDRDKRIIVLMMGAVGGNKTFEYAQSLLTVHLNIHLIVFCGRNEGLLDKIKKIQSAASNSFEALGFTKQVAQYMRLCSEKGILITKPGPLTIEEAKQLRCFMILEGTNPLPWEEANIDFIERNQLGYVMRRSQDLLPLVERYYREEPKFPSGLVANRFDEAFSSVIKESTIS